jgi:hypothetical protein
MLDKLAQQYPPDWTIPPDLQNFSLPEREKQKLLAHLEPDAFSTPLARLEISKRFWTDRVNDIDSGAYYARQSFINDMWIMNGPLDFYTNVSKSKANRFYLDRCEAYHMLWYLDALIKKETV